MSVDDQDGTAKTAERPGLLDPDDQALIGKKLGEYKVERFLGAGGMGVVFKGQQPLIKKAVAIKVLKRVLAQEGETSAGPSSWASRLLDEARAANAVHHPGIVDIIGFGQAPDGRPYLVMEFLDGEALDVRLAEKGRLSVVETLRLLEQVLSALEAAHAAGVIHRDLKPGNVFLQKLADGKDFARLLDFGLSRSVDSSGRGSGIVGTPTYMAPEQAKDGKPTPAVDLYSVGCMAYELLSGRPPFEAQSAWGVIEQHLTKPPKRLSQVVLELDDEVDEFVHSLLDKDATKRPSAKDARRAVARLLRAREDAATIGEKKRKPDPRDAETELGLDAVDLPLPPSKKERRGPVPGTPQVGDDPFKTVVPTRPVGELTVSEQTVVPVAARPARTLALVVGALAVVAAAAWWLLR
jgi:serine/threonine-protein kinase